MPMLSDLQLIYMGPRNSTQLLKINTTKFQVEREPVYTLSYPCGGPYIFEFPGGASAPSFPVLRAPMYPISSYNETNYSCAIINSVIISDHNCDADLKRQMRKFYTNANMLIRKFFKCSVDVKCYLFKTYCSTMYCSAMWFDTTKSAMNKLKVAYNNSLRRLLSLPTYNSASEMFAVLNIPSFGELLRKFAFSFMSRMSSSINVFMVNIYNSSVPLFSKLWGWWYSILTI